MPDVNKRYREAEKLKKYYGINDKQLMHYVEESLKQKNMPEEYLLRKIETRLDNILRHLNFAKNNTHARKLIKLGYIFVNQQRIDDIDYHVSQRDLIALDNRLPESLDTGETEEQGRAIMPAWLKKDDGVGKVKHIPHLHDLPKNFEIILVFQYYASIKKNKDISHLIKK